MTSLISAEKRFSPDVARIAEEVYGTEAQLALEALGNPPEKYYVRCNSLKTSPDELRLSLEKQELRVEQHPDISEALGIHIEGPFDVPIRGQSVVVDKKTAEAVLYGANVYAPGIVSCGSVHVGEQVNVLSEFGDILGSGRAVMTANDILTFRKGLAVMLEHTRFKGPRIRELSEFSKGLLYPQSLPSMVAAHVMDSKPGETVVDMNCAPGGKLTHMSQLMLNSGRIFGFDRNAEKIADTRETVRRIGCTNTVLSIHDSRYLEEDFPKMQADRVLIDPPCSALGLRPKLYDFTHMKRIENLAAYQKQFIRTASKITKESGTIVYSVCTFSLQECEAIIDFAERECNLRAIEQNLYLGLKGLSNYGNSGSLCQRFHPHVHGIGYFIAKFER